MYKKTHLSGAVPGVRDSDSQILQRHIHPLFLTPEGFNTAFGIGTIDHIITFVPVLVSFL